MMWLDYAFGEPTLRNFGHWRRSPGVCGWWRLLTLAPASARQPHYTTASSTRILCKPLPSRHLRRSRARVEYPLFIDPCRPPGVSAGPDYQEFLEWRARTPGLYLSRVAIIGRRSVRPPAPVNGTTMLWAP